MSFCCTKTRKNGINDSSYLSLVKCNKGATGIAFSGWIIWQYAELPTRADDYKGRPEIRKSLR